MSDRYAWRIRVDYRDGRYQDWPRTDEDTARELFAFFSAEIESGRHPHIVRVRRQRRPIGTWETVESR